MRTVEIIIVGGGPGGAAAARRLSAAGREVLVLDKATFPRSKLCAGWITPEVVAEVGLTRDTYPQGFLSFRRLHFHAFGLHVPVPCVQYSIRRYEFDEWMMRRSGASLEQHTVRRIESDDGHFVLDGRYRCRILIGAGGTGCPVRRALFAEFAPRPRALQTATLELEFAHEWRDPDCHLFFFERGLPGYSWYVPKAAGWLNVGVGGMALRLKTRGETIRQHWQHLAERLRDRFGIVLPEEPDGFSYYVRGRERTARLGNAYLVGDAAGLATRDLCEGIGPAIRSGQRAADSIVSGTPYGLDDVTGSSLGGGLVTRAMDWALTRGA